MRTMPAIQKCPFQGWYLGRVELWDQLVGQGLTYQEIADRTYVSVKTVKQSLEKYWSWATLNASSH
jgi:hypothetical protein